MCRDTIYFFDGQYGKERYAARDAAESHDRKYTEGRRNGQDKVVENNECVVTLKLKTGVELI